MLNKLGDKNLLYEKNDFEALEPVLDGIQRNKRLK